MKGIIHCYEMLQFGMTTFYLLRHGTRVSRSEDTELSDVGIKQAERTAKYLENHTITAIYASPLKRVQQTAQIITTRLNLPITTDPRLQERMIYDGRKGDTFEEFLVEWDKTMGDRKYTPFYGDSAEVAGSRIKTLLDEISDNGTHLLVSHAGSIGDILRNLFPDEALPFRSDPDKSLQWVHISECSITEIQKEGDQYFLKRVNDVSHLLD
jgi:broad specificity phosphatase PhoE